MEYLLIFISAIFVNNIILSQFLGICPFLEKKKKISTSLERFRTPVPADHCIYPRDCIIGTNG